MIPTQGFWGAVEVDTYIKDRQGTTWRVCAIDTTVATPGTTGAFRCKNREGEWVTIAPKPTGEPVTIMMLEERADESEALIGLLRDQLGAIEVATQDHATKEWTCPPWPEKNNRKGLADWKAHLELTHRIHTGDMRTYARLVEAHDAAHDPDEPYVGKHLPHTHTNRRPQ